MSNGVYLVLIMAKIKADYAVLITMAGPVKFYKNQCPHGVKGMNRNVCLVGSSDCQMCPDFVEKKQFLIEGTDLVGENVECNHE